MTQIATIVGARPQFVKAAMVSRALRRRPEIDERLIHTGQHYDENLSQVFFDELGIPEPDVHLGVGSVSHGAQTGRMLEKLEAEFANTTPDLALVFGDTNTTLAGALAAAKLQIPLAHVEAGLRSFNRAMPEEINRVVTDHVAELLFAPTETAVANLQREGIAAAQIHLVGDVMFDAAVHFSKKATSDILARLAVEPGEYVLVTVHRAENTDQGERLAAIVEGLGAVAAEVPVVLPAHPRTLRALDQNGLRARLSANVHLIDPVGYLDMIALERNARLIATDSGGVQKEAYFQKVRCVTLREETEWVELVNLGVNWLVPPRSSSAVADGIRAALNCDQAWPTHENLYGGAAAAEAIVDVLLAFLNAGPPGVVS